MVLPRAPIETLTLDWPGRNPTFQDDSEEGIPRRYAGLAPHPSRPNTWLTWLLRDTDFRASGASPQEAINAMAIKLKLERRWEGRIRFIDRDVKPPGDMR